MRRRRCCLLPLATVPLLLLPAACRDRDATTPSGDPVPTRAAVAAASILRDWDQRRSRAWAAGSATALRRLYVPGSQTAAADVRMLGRWRARGLRVVGLTTQLLQVVVVHRDRGRLQLRVTDRVVRAEAGPAGDATSSTPLPRDRPSTYLISLQRYGGQWRVRETTAA